MYSCVQSYYSYLISHLHLYYYHHHTLHLLFLSRHLILFLMLEELYYNLDAIQLLDRIMFIRLSWYLSRQSIPMDFQFLFSLNCIHHQVQYYCHLMSHCLLFYHLHNEVFIALDCLCYSDTFLQFRYSMFIYQKHYLDFLHHKHSLLL